jgi:ketosteroid isomerase-like protein
MPASPRDVLNRLIDGVTNRNWEDLPDLYAEDTVVDHPHDIPAPSRLRGREQLREHFARAAGLPLRIRARDLVVHDTADPEVIVAEFDYDGEVTTTGRTFSIHNIFVLRVRDGRIVESRDYADHFALARAYGRLPEVLAALPADQGPDARSS